MTVALAPLPKVKLTVEDFDLLAANGGLAGLERTELLDGDIYLMSPQYLLHGRAKAFFYNALVNWSQVHRTEFSVLSEVSIAMPPNDEPMPDVIVTGDALGEGAMRVEGVALLVEIAVSSAEFDLGYKADLYARQGVPEYWVVDLAEQRVIRHDSPSPSGYAPPMPFAFGAKMPSATLDALAIDTSDLL